MKTVQKIYINCLMLVFLLAVLVLPAVSGGMMKVNTDDRVLSITSERPVQKPVKNVKPKGEIRKIETVIIREIPATSAVSETNQNTTETSESVSNY